MMITIYIQLLNEGLPVFRPVEAIQVNENAFQIVSTNADVDTEEWEFNTGDTVLCEEQLLCYEPKKLVAIRKV